MQHGGVPLEGVLKLMSDVCVCVCVSIYICVSESE